MTAPPKNVGAFVATKETARDLQVLESIAEWLDRRYLDPLIGIFLPGGGNTLCSLIGLYAVVVAGRLRVHPIIIARMLLNLAIDAVIGAIPFVGWIGDFIYRAHVKNLELLKARGERGEPESSDYWIVALAALAFVGAIVGTFLVTLLLAGWLLGTLWNWAF
jgi:hypothetical protein